MSSISDTGIVRVAEAAKTIYIYWDRDGEDYGWAWGEYPKREYDKPTMGLVQPSRPLDELDLEKLRNPDLSDEDLIELVKGDEDFPKNNPYLKFEIDRSDVPSESDAEPPGHLLNDY